MTLDQINQLDHAEAHAALLECCGSQAWALQMAAKRPFHDIDHLWSCADSSWWDLGTEDWLEAFSKHPKIGERGSVSKWSAEEQSGVSHAEEQTLRMLSDLNNAYLEKFGWIYIVCAAGKSAQEMLALLQRRMRNEKQEELRIAAKEQAKITDLRIGKLLAQ